MSAPTWTTIAELRPGAVFTTREGALFVKVRNPDGGDPFPSTIVSLIDGIRVRLAAHAGAHDATQVLELDITSAALAGLPKGGEPCPDCETGTHLESCCPLCGSPKFRTCETCKGTALAPTDATPAAAGGVH